MGYATNPGYENPPDQMGSPEMGGAGHPGQDYGWNANPAKISPSQHHTAEMPGHDPKVPAELA